MLNPTEPGLVSCMRCDTQLICRLCRVQGNKLLWGYSEGMDSELQQVFDLALQSGINLMDTADSYGTKGDCVREYRAGPQHGWSCSELLR